MTMYTVFHLLLLSIITCLQWMMPTLVRPTVPFGVRVPLDRVASPVIATQRRRYRALVAGTGALAVAGLLALSVTGAANSGPPYLLLAALAAFGLYYYLAHRAIRRQKQAESWYEGHRQVAVADTSLRTDPPRFPWMWASPAASVILATAVASVVAYPRIPQQTATAFGPVAAQLGLTTMIIFLCLMTFRSRADLDAEQPVTSAVQHRRYVVTMARTILGLAALVDASIGLAAVLSWPHGSAPSAVLAASLVPGLVGLVAIAAVAIRTGQTGSRLPATDRPDRPAGTTRDDDRYWLAGLFYVNRDDRSLLVPKRFGIGSTVNFGNPWSWLLLATILGVVLAPSLARAVLR